MAGARPVWVVPPDSPRAAADRQRALELGLACRSDIPEHGFHLIRDARGLALKQAQSPRTRGLYCALCEADEWASRLGGGHRSPLARAMGLHRHPPGHVLDTTAGLARDAATLAALGCRVTALERQAALFAMLDDATRQVGEYDPPPAWWCRWEPPIHADAIPWLQHAAAPFDIIYMDPMFASPRRKSAPQKALAWLAELAGPDEDATTLLASARHQALQRVVVKQHARAQPLAAPDHQIHGRAIRFDVYLTHFKIPDQHAYPQ